MANIKVAFLILYVVSAFNVFTQQLFYLVFRAIRVVQVFGLDRLPRYVRFQQPV